MQMSSTEHILHFQLLEREFYMALTSVYAFCFEFSSSLFVVILQLISLTTDQFEVLWSYRYKQFAVLYKNFLVQKYLFKKIGDF